MKLLMILLCKGSYAPVSPPFKGQAGSAPVMHPRSGVPGFRAKNALDVWKHTYAWEHIFCIIKQVKSKIEW